jgi:hypothetical protein
MRAKFRPFALACVVFAGACTNNLGPERLAALDAANLAKLQRAIPPQPPQPPEPTMSVGDKTVSVREWNVATAAVRNVASFEMSCPPAQLEFIILSGIRNLQNGVGPGFNPWTTATQLGVTGCGQRRVYTEFDFKWTSGGPASTGGVPGNP